MESTILAYIAGFLDGDGSIFFQIIPNKDRTKFQIRSTIAFYQKKQYSEILEWLKGVFEGVGYIRHRKTGISDYTIVESKEVYKILKLLQPYIRLKKKQVELGLEILNKLDNRKSEQDFLEICKLVDKFKDLNYSKKRTITSELVEKNKFIPL
jgi:hypothetical protein